MNLKWSYGVVPRKKATIYCCFFITMTSDERHLVSNHRSSDCLFNNICAPTTEKHQNPHYWPYVRGIHRWPSEFPAQRASKAEKVSIWWRQFSTRRPHLTTQFFKAVSFYNGQYMTTITEYQRNVISKTCWPSNKCNRHSSSNGCNGYQFWISAKAKIHKSKSDNETTRLCQTQWCR